MKDVDSDSVRKYPPGKERLKLEVQPGAIKHLGIKLYHRPADVVSELVANAWDADATRVAINIDSSNKQIEVDDDGIGMTYSEVQNLYLQMGRDRRVDTGKDRTASGRSVLGRKGIGKFSGLGIAKSIEIETVSNETKELTIFEISPEFDGSIRKELEELISYQEWSDADSSRNSGTKVRLKNIGNSLDNQMIERFKKSLSRRFIFSENTSDLPFLITVNDQELEIPFSEAKQFDFPSDLSAEEKAELGVLSVDENGWAKAEFEGIQSPGELDTAKSQSRMKSLEALPYLHTAN